MPRFIYKKADQLLRSSDPGSADAALSLLKSHVEAHPQDAKGWFELAGGYNFLGREVDALPCYEKTRSLGLDKLPLEDQPRLYIQLGSTLRNLKKYEESKKVLLEGIAHFPNTAALKAFLGLTEYSSGNPGTAAKLFLKVSLTHDESIKDYTRALKYYEEQIDTFPEPPSPVGTLHHIDINVSDLKRSTLFWEWFLLELGYRRFSEWKCGVGWKLGDTYIDIIKTEDSHRDAGYHRKRTGLNHIAFHARSRTHLDQLTEKLKARGIPILYPEKHPFAGGPNYYAVFFEDPDRIKVEIAAP